MNVGTIAPVDGCVLDIFRKDARVADAAIVQAFGLLRQRGDVNQLFKNA